MGFLIPLTCFPDIRLLSIVHSGEAVSVEVNDRYERQSLRNRYSICGSQGKLDLSIPVTLDESRMYAGREHTGALLQPVITMRPILCIMPMRSKACFYRAK